MTHDPVGAFTWLAVASDGSAVWEDEVGSLRAVPRDRIARLAVVLRADPTDATMHGAVSVPADADPVCFWRTRIEIPVAADGTPDPANQTQTVTRVIGWRRGDTQTLLWVHADGSVLMTDGDPDSGVWGG